MFLKKGSALFILFCTLSLTGVQAQSYQFSHFAPAKADPKVKKNAAVAISSTGNVYVLDQGTFSIHVYDGSGTQIDVIKDVTIGGAPVLFKKPKSIFIDQADNLYIVDEGLMKVFVRPTIGPAISFGEKGAGIGQMELPLGIAADQHGYIYVLNGKRKQIDIYHKNGDYLTFIAGGGTPFEDPAFIGVNGKNEIYVMERKAMAIHVFDYTGLLVRSYTNLGGVSKPIAMAVFRNGEFFILDDANQQITQFSKEGKKVGTLGSKGKKLDKGVFMKASFLAAGTARDKSLAILDAKANQTQVFTVATPNAPLKPDGKRMQYYFAKTARPPLKSLAVAPNGTRYAIRYDNDKKFVALADSGIKEVFPEKPVGQAAGIATDKQSNVYVVDRKSREVIMYDKQGVQLRKFGQDIRDKLKDPSAIAIQSNGNILVADKGQGNVYMWNSQGVFEKLLVPKGLSRMESPNAMSVDSKDQIYIWDDKLNGILRFGPAGEQLNTYVLSVRPEKPGGKPGLIQGFYIDPLDQVHVFNYPSGQIEVFVWESQPVPLFTFGRPGGNAGFTGFEAMIMDPMLFRTYVTESKTKTQKVVQFIIKPPVPDNIFTFDVQGEKLKVDFKPLDAKTVVAYALLGADKSGADSVVQRTTGNSFLVEEPTGEANPRLKKYRMASLSQTDMSDPIPAFDNYFGYANRLYAAERYDEALSAYMLGLEKTGKPQNMVNYVSSQLTKIGRRYAGSYEMQKAMLFLRSAYTLTPDQKPTINGLAFGYTKMFQQLSNQLDFENLVLEAEGAIQNETLRPFVFSTIDSISGALAKQPNETSIANAVNLQKKLNEWNAGDAGSLTSLASISYELYKFKKTSGSPGFELDVIISEAQTAAEEAVRIQKENKKPFLETQLLYLELLNSGRRYADAEQLALRELQESSASITKPLQIRFRKQLAEAYRGQGGEKLESAVKEFQRTLQLEGDNVQTKINLADVLIQSKKYDDAKMLYQQLLVKDMKNVEYIARIGKIELLKGNFDEASFQLEKVIKLRPEDRSLYGPLAEAFEGASKSDRALENYKVAIQYLEQRLVQARNQMSSSDEINALQGQLNKYLENVANIYNNLAMFEEAIAAFQRVTAANPASANAYFGLGQAYLSSGLVYDAMKALYRAKTLDPNNQTYANAHFSAMSERDKMVKNEPPFNIIDARIKNIFPSLFKNYSDASQLPLGEVVLTNNTPQPSPPGSVELKIFIPELMNAPTAQKVPALVGFSNTPIKLTALFDEKKILSIAEEQKLQATVEMTYTFQGQPKTVSRTVQIVVHGRNQISWTDKRRLASFVSPNVEELINYNKQVDVLFRDAPAFGLNKVLLKAMQVFSVLNKSKFVYSPDPEQSFALVTTNTDILDFLQYPAETLKRRSGDCDDLVTVFAGILENAGIATAYVDVPGHVFMAFDSQIKPNEVAASGFDAKDVVVLYDKVWIPIETTLLGTQSFLTAWKSASERYYKELAAGRFPEIVPMSDARRVYQPSNFIPEGFAEEPPAASEVLMEYQSQVTELLTKTKREVLREMANRYENEPENVFVKNKYGMLLAQIGKTAEADKVLLEALALSPGNPAVLNNLGNVAYFAGNADRATEFFGRAAASNEGDGEIYINLAKAWLLKGDKEQAKTYFTKAVGINGDLASLYDYLAKEIQ